MACITFGENKKRDVVLIGRVTLDFNPNEMNRTLDKVKTFSMYLGGSPGNMAVGINKLGKSVGFIGCISDDQFGDFVLNYFNDRGIDTSQMVRARHGERMGLTFTEIKSPTESSILMYRDKVADLQITPQDVDEQYIADSKILIISGTALSASPSREACLIAAQYAKKHNTRIIFDIDYRPYSWQSKEEISIYYSLVAGMSDVVIGSRDEVNLTELLAEDAAEPADHVLAEKYNVSDTTIAAAWILRHPANMQIITGTASESRLKEIIAACEITLTREEWYELYLAAGHPLP